ncbi:MAG: methyltransferase [Candidatus Binatia bacterium]|nr:MAG: methyltransferase [Candidatus Binatia bacterium]
MLTVDLSLLALEPGNTVLDLGCGTGRHARALRMLDGVRAVALDLSEKEIGAAAGSLREMDGNGARGPWLAVRGDAYVLPFRDASFDCVVASEIFEHLDEDDLAFREVTRVLRPGGILALSVPRFGPEAVCWALSSSYRHSEGGHVRIYRERELRRKLSRHGYDVYARHFAHGLHSPYWWLRCLVGLENEDAWLVRRYHDLLVRDLFEKPWWTRALDRTLTPFVGKSLVLYARRVV